MKNLTPKWLYAKWVNGNHVASLLYPDKSEGSRSGILSQKKSGKRKWTDEELRRLEKIKAEIMIELIDIDSI